MANYSFELTKCNCLHGRTSLYFTQMPEHVDTSHIPEQFDSELHAAIVELANLSSTPCEFAAKFSDYVAAAERSQLDVVAALRCMRDAMIAECGK